MTRTTTTAAVVVPGVGVVVGVAVDLGAGFGASYLLFIRDRIKIKFSSFARYQEMEKRNQISNNTQVSDNLSKVAQKVTLIENFTPSSRDSNFTQTTM